MKFNHLLPLLLLLPALGWAQPPASRVIVKFKSTADVQQSVNSLRASLRATGQVRPLMLEPLKRTADGAVVMSLGGARSDTEVQQAIHSISRSADGVYGLLYTPSVAALTWNMQNLI